MFRSSLTRLEFLGLTGLMVRIRFRGPLDLIYGCSMVSEFTRHSLHLLYSLHSLRWD